MIFGEAESCDLAATLAATGSPLAPTPIISLVFHRFLTRFQGLPRRLSRAALTLIPALLSCTCVNAQLTAEPVKTLTNHGRILLVLPFDNRTGQPSLEWIREAAAELLSTRFASAGFAPMTRADRVYALDHLGLPQGFQPSRASSLKLAQTLDADYIIVGNYRTDGNQIEAQAQLVDVSRLRMTPVVTSYGAMGNMIAVFDSLAWKLTRELDPSFSVAEATFVAAGESLRIDAYEQYIRGITEPDQAERLRHLSQSVLLSPAFSPAWMALGREQYLALHYEEAAQAFARVDSNSQDSLEAGFSRGLSLLFSGNYAEAEKVFATVVGGAVEVSVGALNQGDVIRVGSAGAVVGEIVDSGDRLGLGGITGPEEPPAQANRESQEEHG